MKTPFLKLAYQIVLENMEDESFDVTTFYQAMAMSRTQLHRRLKAEIRLSTTGFIRYVRIEEAKRLLREGDLSISEIAYACGFRHISTFNRVFRDSVGMTPSVYRDLHANGSKNQY